MSSKLLYLYVRLIKRGGKILVPFSSVSPQHSWVILCLGAWEFLGSGGSG